MNVEDQTDYTVAIATCTNEVCAEVCPVNLVVPHYFYQIVQMDKPMLSDEEIIQSLPWTTKDLVDIPPENIVADFIDYPIVLPMQSSKMNVFITNKLQLMPFIDSFSKIKPVLRAMTSEEMILVKKNSRFFRCCYIFCILISITHHDLENLLDVQNRPSREHMFPLDSAC